MQSSAPVRRRVLRVPHLRAANRAAVLQLLRRYRRLSRAETARRTGLSEGAVSRIVAELIRQELVVEQGGEDATGGRPAIRLELNDARFQAVGVEIQNRETRISVGTITGTLLDTQRLRTPATPEQTLQLVAGQVQPLLSAAVSAVGVSARGLVNSRTGVAELGNNPAWVHVEIGKYLAGQLGRPVFVENNVRAAATAEYNYGSPETQGTHCMLFVKVDEGIGMGIIMDGKLYRGSRMAAGEFGQMVIAESGGAARHDRPGCVEMLASNDALCERYRSFAGLKSAGDSEDQVKRICHLAMSGDAAARRAVMETARYLGIGIANAVWALDADAVVIDGALTEAWPLVADAVRDQFPDPARFVNFRKLMLRPSALAGEAAMIGAVTLPFAHLFSSEEGGQ